MLSDAIDFAQIKRVLVIKLRHHGDVLLSAPVLSTLKQHAPHLEIDALVYADTAPMLSHHPDLSHLYCIDRQWKKLGVLAQAQAEWGLLRTLQSRHYDLVIHLTDHKRGAWLTRLLKPRYAVAPSASFGKLFKKVFSHRYAVVGGNRRHTVDIHLDALRRLGLRPSVDSARLQLAIPADAAESAAAKRRAIGIPDGQSYILIHPTSRWMFKTWPPAQMAALIHLLQQRGETVLLTAAPDPVELETLAKIEHDLDHKPASLAGALSLKELGALIAGASEFIGMDSVPMHMAAAVNTPVVALFGPSGDVEWGPWKVPHRIVSAPFSCRPCGRDGCGGSKQSDCINSLTPETVLAALDDLRRETRP